MGKEVKAGGQNRFKKEYNNYNPYNKLDLNKFHQIKEHSYNKQGHQLHKKKRDLERMIEHFKSKGLEVEQSKLQELQRVEQQLQHRKKDFEKGKRKEFFLSSKYKQIMNIEKRKVAKHLREIKQKHPQDLALYAEWLRKLNYIKYFPKNLKYISLFPNTPLSPQAAEFQLKIINDIQADLNKKKQKLNHFEAEYKAGTKRRPNKKDDFFLEESEQDQAVEAEEQAQDEGESVGEQGQEEGGSEEEICEQQ